MLPRLLAQGIVALAGLTILLSVNLVNRVSTQELEAEVINSLRSGVDQQVKGAVLSDWNIVRDKDSMQVWAEVLSQRVIDDTMVLRIEQEIERDTGTKPDLIIRTFTTNDYSAEGKWYQTEVDREKGLATADQPEGT